jgi:septal ring factor EnvC (AmiA/AmiB activator)
MGKSRKGIDKEYSEIQRLKHENRELKRSLSRLRKQLDRVDLEQYENIKELVEIQAEEERARDHTKDLESLKQRWVCHKCQGDYLRIIIISRRDGVHYFRKCGSCPNRTKVKKYTNEVEGIKEDEK